MIDVTKEKTVFWIINICMHRNAFIASISPRPEARPMDDCCLSRIVARLCGMPYKLPFNRAGFVVAEVELTLDKKQGSFQQVISPNAVKQDLVISAYKPNGDLEKRLVAERGAAPDVAWDFVQVPFVQLANGSKSKNGAF